MRKEFRKQLAMQRQVGRMEMMEELEERETDGESRVAIECSLRSCSGGIE